RAVTVSRGAGIAFSASSPTRARAIASLQAAVSAAAGPEMRSAAPPTGSSWSAGGAWMEAVVGAGAGWAGAAAVGAGAGAPAQASTVRDGRTRARRIEAFRGEATIRQGLRKNPETLACAAANGRVRAGKPPGCPLRRRPPAPRPA